MRVFIQVSLATAVLSIVSVRGEEDVYFADQSLQACIENALDTLELDPTPTDLLQLGALDCSHAGIERLGGIQYATNLRSLILGFNEIEDIGPLGDLINLERLRINDNKISSLTSLRDLKKLDYLDVANNSIQRVSGLSEMTKLETLSLEGNQITDIAALCCLPSLEDLNLEQNELTEVSRLQGLPELKTLNLYDNRISDLSGLSGLEYLSSLNLGDNDISSIAPLTSLTRLKSLNLEKNPNLNDEAFDHDLQTILDNNPGISLTYDPRLFPSLGVRASRGTFGDRIRVSWDAVNNGPLYTSFYRVYRASSAFEPKTAVTDWQRDTAFEDTRVDAATEYQYWVSVALNEFGESAQMDEMPARGWAGQFILMLSSTAGGVVTTSVDLPKIRLGDVVEIAAESVDAELFAFAAWSGSAVDEGSVLDPTDPVVRLVLDQAQSLRAHFVTTLPTLHVTSGEPASVDPSPTLALGTPLQPFSRIQHAIDVSGQGVTILVEPGIYAENLRLKGKNVVLTGIDYPVLQDSEGVPLVSFVSGEDANCVLNGFLLTLGENDNASALYCENSDPIISNCLIVGNQTATSDAYGSAVYAVNSQMTLVNCTIADNLCGSLGAGIMLVDSNVAVTNSIVWNNSPYDLRLEGTSRPQISYSNIILDPAFLESPTADPGNLEVDPRFVRSGQWAELMDGGKVWTAGDYHLRSESGRWDRDSETWVADDDTSPCIDGGDPTWPVGSEPIPHGERMNMGAYGGTVEAAKSITLLPTDPVYFADQNLKACVEEVLQIFNPTLSDVLQLTRLDCSHASIENITGIQYATNLETLRLPFNEIKSISPLAKLIDLKSLTINDNQIDSISALSDMNLRYLDAHNNQIQSVRAVSGMTNLQTLVLYGNQITSISALSGLEQLSSVDVSDNNISSIRSLASLTQLQSVDLRGNELNDEAYSQHIPRIIANNPDVSLKYDARP